MMNESTRTTSHDLIISLMSFNMGNAQIDYLQEIFSQCEYNPDADLFVFGLQESTFSSSTPQKHSSIGNEKMNRPHNMTKSGSMKDLSSDDVGPVISKTLGDKFYKVIFYQYDIWRLR